jgi:hypothetical protein
MPSKNGPKNVTDTPLWINNVLKKIWVLLLIWQQWHITHQSYDRERALQILSWINIVPVPTVLSTDIPTQMEPSFISDKSFGWRRPSSIACKSSYKDALFFSHKHLHHLLALVLFYMAADVMLLVTFYSILKTSTSLAKCATDLRHIYPT